MRDARVKVHVEDGLSKSEKYVEIRFGNVTYRMVTPVKNLDLDTDELKVKAGGSREGKTLIRLPVTCFTHGDTIMVPSELVT